MVASKRGVEGIFMKKFLLVLSLLSLFFGTELMACNISIPDMVGRCEPKIKPVLEKISLCEKAEEALLSFVASANENSTTLCNDIVSILECLKDSSSNGDNLIWWAEALDYTGAAAWVYLACRSMLKSRISSIGIEDFMQSMLQRFLSDERTAFWITIPSLASFLALKLNSPGWTLAISLLCSSGPISIGVAQCCFDVWKIIKFCLKRCGFCMPFVEEQEAMRVARREYYINLRETADHEIELIDQEMAAIEQE